MDRYAIVKQRKELKKCAHKTVKSHYMLLVFLTLLLAFFGTEFTDSVSGLKDHGSLRRMALFLKEVRGKRRLLKRSSTRSSSAICGAGRRNPSSSRRI